MDGLISRAARALAAGDPLAALNQVALREDAPALALRGIAMAQLGEFARATVLLRAAASAFGHRQPAARARCVVAQAEVALAARNLAWPDKALSQARAVLRGHGDLVNAAYAALLSARRQLLMGRLDEAERTLADLRSAALPAATHAMLELIHGGIALRRVQARAASAALARAADAARRAGIPALQAEVEQACAALHAPAARLQANGQERVLTLHQVEVLLASSALIVDGCRHTLRRGPDVVPLASRPILFALAWQLATAWPAWPMARHGPVRRWHWCWAPASARSSGRWRTWRRPGRRSRWARGGRAVGRCRPYRRSPLSRQACYSPGCSAIRSMTSCTPLSCNTDPPLEGHRHETLSS